MHQILLISLLFTGLSSGLVITRDNTCFKYLKTAKDVPLAELNGLWVQNAFAISHEANLNYLCTKEIYQTDGDDGSTASFRLPAISARYPSTTYTEAKLRLLKDPQNPKVLQYFASGNESAEYYYFLILSMDKDSLVGIRCPDFTNAWETVVILTKAKPAETKTYIYDLYNKAAHEHNLNENNVVKFIQQKGCPKYNGSDETPIPGEGPTVERRHLTNTETGKHEWSPRSLDGLHSL